MPTAAEVFSKAEFVESEHPRDDDGKFTSGDDAGPTDSQFAQWVLPSDDHAKHDKALQDAATPAYRERVAAAFDKKYPDGTTVYRGVTGDAATALKSLKKGDTLPKRDALVSSTTDEKIAHYYVYSPLKASTAKDRVVIVYEGVRGKNVFASDASHGQIFGEHRSKTREVVLEPATEWKVTDRYRSFITDQRPNKYGKQYGTTFIHVSPVEEKAEKMIFTTADEILGLPTAADVLAKAVIDNLGYHHGDDGKFIPKTGESRVPAHIKAHEGERHAVFMFGGSGSGKGAFIRGYVGNHGMKDRARNNIIDENHPEYRAPEKGFSHKDVIDSDAVKGQIGPLYSGNPDKNGMYGPSGPKSFHDFMQYPEKVREAADKFIAKNTRYKNAEDYFKNPPPNTYPQMDGLTHSLSSYVAKQKLEQKIRSKKGGSFIYDATGGLSHMKYAQTAMENGYRVTFHYVDTAEPVANHRNYLRGQAEGGRAVDRGIVHGTHSKVRRDKPTIRRFVADQAKDGKKIHMVTSPNYTRSDLETAEALGYGKKHHV